MRRKSVCVVFLAILFLTAGSTALAHDDMEGMDMGDSGSGHSDSGAIGAMAGNIMLGAHMNMTEPRPMRPEDTARAQHIMQVMRDKLSRYQDYKVAEADGYIPFLENIPQDVYHFSSRSQTASEYRGDIDLAHPGSLLYQKKTFGGYKLVGAMYSAPSSYTPDQLDQVIPLALTRWHEHTNICLPPGITEEDAMEGRVMPSQPSIHQAYDPTRGSSAKMRYGYLTDPRWGFEGTISDQANCESAGGTFHPQIFGWMVHVYPFASDDLKVAFGLKAP